MTWQCHRHEHSEENEEVEEAQLDAQRQMVLMKYCQVSSYLHKGSISGFDLNTASHEKRT